MHVGVAMNPSRTLRTHPQLQVHPDSLQLVEEHLVIIRHHPHMPTTDALLSLETLDSPQHPHVLIDLNLARLACIVRVAVQPLSHIDCSRTILDVEGDVGRVARDVADDGDKGELAHVDVVDFEVGVCVGLRGGADLRDGDWSEGIASGLAVRRRGS